MAREGKRMRKLREMVNPLKEYSVEDACKLVVQTKSAKFDETVDLVVTLGVDPRKAEQNVRGSVPLPHGLGKTIRVLVFAKGEKANEARESGAEFVGAEDLVEKINAGFTDFDSVVATPDMMAHVGKVGKVLGPRGLMPSPKIGTVTFEIAATVRSIKAGRAEFRVDKSGLVHTAIGKASFGSDKVVENAMAMLNALQKAKPSTSKGIYFQKAALSLTMGPSVKLDLSPLRG